MYLFNHASPFYKGALHQHTTRSDGVRSPEDVASMYNDAGYDFITLTDHWKCYADINIPGILTLPGMEIDYNLPDQVVHLVGIGIDPDALPQVGSEPGALRRWFRERSIQDGIDMLRSAGGVVELAHPAWSLNTFDTVKSLGGLFAMEMFNSVSRPPWNADRSEAPHLSDVCSTAGILLPLTAVDDAHFYEGEQCSGFVMLQADELSRDAIVRALAAGAFYASRGPVIEQVEITPRRVVVTTRPAEQAVFATNAVYNGDRVVVNSGGTEWVYDRKESLNESFVRCEITDAAGLKAWTSPVSWSA